MLAVWCVGTISRVTQLPYRATGITKNPVECSFPTGPTRRSSLFGSQVTYRYVHFLLRYYTTLLSADGFILAFLRSENKCSEARTGYLSGYISSSALNVGVQNPAEAEHHTFSIHKS